MFIAIPLAGIGSPGLARERAAANFRIDEISFLMPIPKGFCLPSGVYLVDAQQTAMADLDNQTHLTLYPCRNGVIEPNGATISVKTPRSMLHVEMDMDKFNTFMGQNWGRTVSSNQSEIDQMLSKAKARSKSALNVSINVKNEIRPMGQDAVCRYLGGAFDASSETATQTIFVGGCMSIVAGRVLTFYRYERKLGGGGFNRILSNVRTLRSSVKGKNLKQ